MKIKPIYVVILGASLAAGECLGQDKDKHIEPPQYRATPALVGHAWDVANASTATVTTVSSMSIFPEQESPYETSSD